MWDYFELFFCCCYLLECLTKMWLFGPISHFCGVDRLWNLFDFTCLGLGIVDLAITFVMKSLEADRSGGGVGLLKVLRIARLARMLRALLHSIFDELKAMVLGVVAGVRVLAWAIVPSKPPLTE